MRALKAILAALFVTTNAVASEVATDPNLFSTRVPTRDADVYTWSLSSAEISMNRPYLGFFVEKDGRNRPDAPTIVISAKTANGLKPECRNAAWIVDGEALKPVKQYSHQARLPQSGVLDNLNSIFTLHSLRTVASAKTVKYKLCESEYTMSDKERAGLRNVLALYDGKLVIREHPRHD